MRFKTSVTLPSALLKEIDRVDRNRSAFLERAAVEYLAKAEKARQDIKDATILEKIADELNKECDAFEFQGMPR